jgi:hypothetical protein
MLNLTGVSLETESLGDNRPAMNASFPTGNNGSDAGDGTRAARKFQCGEPLSAAHSRAVFFRDKMLVNAAAITLHASECERFVSSRETRVHRKRIVPPFGAAYSPAYEG